MTGVVAIIRCDRYIVTAEISTKCVVTHIVL